jgi:hypothetical protein
MMELPSGASLTFNKTVVSGYTAAGFQVAGALMKIVFADGTISGNKVGIDASGAPTASITITGSSLTNNTTAILAPAPKLRNTTVFGNGTGISPAQARIWAPSAILATTI